MAARARVGLYRDLRGNAECAVIWASELPTLNLAVAVLQQLKLQTAPLLHRGKSTPGSKPVALRNPMACKMVSAEGIEPSTY